MLDHKIKLIPHLSLFRFIVRRQEILQRQLEKAEEHLSAKSTAKETLDRNVSTILIAN